LKKARTGACCLVTASPGETIVIGEGSMVAAGSVVTKSVPPYTLVAGVPAKPMATLKYLPAKGISYKHFKSGIIRLLAAAESKQEGTHPGIGQDKGGESC